MSIQFACRSCDKAIEVDDDWAHRLVECPYCHDTVTALGFSSVRPAVARPMEGPTRWSSDPAAGPETRPEHRPGANKIALVALVLALATLALLFWVGVTCGPDLAKATEGLTTRAQFEGVVKTALEKQEPWVVRLTLGLLGVIGLWLSGLICGIVGVFRRPRRGPAVAALVILLGLLVINLLTMGGWS